ncbi:MAG: L-lactate dehydrogenase [Clostridia bacterium]|nr:L-lactate dehydrogenase [Clostridia bacterium]
MSKITIIGAGSVGATVGYAMSLKGTASEIVLVDINERKAEGEALDIRQGMPYSPQNKIYAGTYEDAKGSDIVVITSGVPRKAGMSRLDLAQVNVNVIKSIAPQITKYAPDAVYIIVSNPVDVLTYVFQNVSGIPEERVIGTGTLLDTARLRTKLSENFNISMKNVHAYVYGEHGDSSFIPWSISNISGIDVWEYPKHILNKTNMKQAEFTKEEITEHVKKSGGWIIERKGATFYAIAACVTHICGCILSGVEIALTVSTRQHGEYDGVDDVCLSTLALIGRHGVCGKIVFPLTDEELKSLQTSAVRLKEVINSVEI